MKSLLMHRDRDFDANGSLRDVMYGYLGARREQELRLPDHEQLIQDLELDVLFRAMSGDDKFLFEVARKAVLSGVQNDPDSIRYRQQALKDCLNNREVVRKLYAITVDATTGTRKLQWESSTYQYPTSLLLYAIDLLEALSGKLREVREIAEKSAQRFESEAFRTLLAMLQNELTDDYLAKISGHLSDLRFRKGMLLSAELDEHNDATNYTLRRRAKGEPKWLDRLLGKRPATYTFYIAERDQAGGEILTQMRRRGISRAAVALAQSGEHVLRFFTMLRTELAFYLCCLNLHPTLVNEGSALCFPVLVEAGRGSERFRGLYDICLALHTRGSVVANTTDAAGKRLVLITGANQGGKSTFLRSVGVAQLMMQAGMFVGAVEFAAELRPALFTHYKREEDASMKSGKLDEELARMSDIADRIVPNAMVLFNESFAATNEREGSEIARQIVSALLEKHVRVVYVTHLVTFARTFWERDRERALFLRAERNPDGVRTYRMIEGEPLETSYGADLYLQVFEAGGQESSGKGNHAQAIVDA
jgi:DNA mismatch repair ATPase MutS